MKKEEVIGKKIEEMNLDGIWITDPYNMRYLSGFTGGTGALYISRKRKVLFTDSRYTTQASSETDDFEVIEVSGTNSYIVALNTLIEKDKVKVLGFEDQVMIYGEYKKYEELSKVKSWIPIGNSISELRRIKSERELELLAKAVEIGDKAYSYILDFIKPGITETQIAVELEGFMKKNGATGISFDFIVASGVNSSMPHATPGHKKIEKGDFVTMDFGCVYEGYCSDMTRTIVIGKADKKQKEIYNIVLEAQLAALEVISAGLAGNEVDKVARDIITKAGYGECFGHGLGHGVGLFIHEEPRLSPLDPTILEANMVETVEPGIYIPGEYGVRIEDMVIVTKDGHRNLTHSSKKLIEI